MVLSHSLLAPYRPLFSPVHRSPWIPSSWTRTPNAFLHGGRRRSPSRPSRHLNTGMSSRLGFLNRIAFTNGSVYQGYTFGFSAQFGPVTHFSLAAIPPHFDGVHLTVVSSASKASVLQQELLSLLLKGAIEEVPKSDLEQGFFSRYFLVPKRASRRWRLLCLVFEWETGLSLSTRKMPIFIFRSFGGTGSLFGSLLEGRLTNTRFFPLAWLWHRGHSQSAWMLHSGPFQGVSEPSQGCCTPPHSWSWPLNEHQEECSLPFSTNCVFGSSLGFRSNAGLSGSCLDFQTQYTFSPLQARPSCLRKHLSQALRPHGLSPPPQACGLLHMRPFLWGWRF